MPTSHLRPTSGYGTPVGGKGEKDDSSGTTTASRELLRHGQDDSRRIAVPVQGIKGEEQETTGKLEEDDRDGSSSEQENAQNFEKEGEGNDDEKEEEEEEEAKGEDDDKTEEYKEEEEEDDDDEGEEVSFVTPCRHLHTPPNDSPSPSSISRSSCHDHDNFVDQPQVHVETYSSISSTDSLLLPRRHSLQVVRSPLSRTLRGGDGFQHAQPEIPNEIATLSSKNGSGDTDEHVGDAEDENRALNDIIRENEETNVEEEEQSVQVDEDGNSNFGTVLNVGRVYFVEPGDDGPTPKPFNWNGYMGNDGDELEEGMDEQEISIISEIMTRPEGRLKFYPHTKNGYANLDFAHFHLLGEVVPNSTTGCLKIDGKGNQCGNAARVYEQKIANQKKKAVFVYCDTHWQLKVAKGTLSQRKSRLNKAGKITRATISQGGYVPTIKEQQKRKRKQSKSSRREKKFPVATEKGSWNARSASENVQEDQSPPERAPPVEETLTKTRKSTSTNNPDPTETNTTREGDGDSGDGDATVGLGFGENDDVDRGDESDQSSDDVVFVDVRQTDIRDVPKPPKNLKVVKEEANEHRMETRSQYAPCDLGTAARRQKDGLLNAPIGPTPWTRAAIMGYAEFLNVERSKEQLTEDEESTQEFLELTVPVPIHPPVTRLLEN